MERSTESWNIHKPTHLGNQHEKGPIHFLVAEEVTENQLTAKQEALFPLGPHPHTQHHKAEMWVALPWQIPKALPPTK